MKPCPICGQSHFEFERTVELSASAGSMMKFDVYRCLNDQDRCGDGPTRVFVLHPERTEE